MTGFLPNKQINIAVIPVVQNAGKSVYIEWLNIWTCERHDMVHKNFIRIKLKEMLGVGVGGGSLFIVRNY